MTIDVKAISDLFWTEVDRRAERIARAIVAEETRNLRYGGPEAYEAHIFAPTVASITEAASALWHVGQQCRITSVDLHAEPGCIGTAKIGLGTVRHDDPMGMIDPLFEWTGGPGLSAEDYYRTYPGAGWRTFLEAECTLVMYIVVCTNIKMLNVAVNVRAL